MSRKDYVAIAQKLAWADHCESEQYRSVAHDAINVATFGIADVLAADNPRFDRCRFLAAARGES
jgi:hypothetical protein